MGEDITTNEVLNVKLDYIQKDIAVIKSDVKEIKSDYITRREFVEKIQDFDRITDTRFKVAEGRVDKLYSIVYWVVGLLGAATFASLAKYIFVK